MSEVLTIVKPKKCRRCGSTELVFKKDHIHGDIDAPETDDIWECPICDCIYGKDFLEFPVRLVDFNNVSNKWRLN